MYTSLFSSIPKSLIYSLRAVSCPAPGVLLCVCCVSTTSELVVEYNQQPRDCQNWHGDPEIYFLFKTVNHLDQFFLSPNPPVTASPPLLPVPKPTAPRPFKLHPCFGITVYADNFILCSLLYVVQLQ